LSNLGCSRAVAREQFLSRIRVLEKFFSLLAKKVLDGFARICYNKTVERRSSKMTKEIWFDMDGTIANLYAVENWLADLRSESVRPYAEALPMLNFSLFARLLNRLQADGWKIGIISWTAKNGSETYNLAVEIGLAYGVVVDEVKVSYSRPCKSFHHIASHSAETEDGNSGVPEGINASLSY
jgi:hypothetical protein